MAEAKFSDKEATGLQLQFWQELINPIPDLNRLQELAGKINSSIAECLAAFASLLKLQPTSTEVLRMQASFLIGPC